MLDIICRKGLLVVSPGGISEPSSDIIHDLDKMRNRSSDMNKLSAHCGQKKGGKYHEY